MDVGIKRHWCGDIDHARPGTNIHYERKHRNTWVSRDRELAMVLEAYE